MFVKIYMGNTLIHNIKAKRIDVSLDGVFIKITDMQNNVIQTSPTNVIIIEQEKGSERYGYEATFDRQGSI